jgi:heme exporter protein C
MNSKLETQNSKLQGETGNARLFTAFAGFTFALMSYGMYQALIAAPTERTMGAAQRIFYIHVPSAWVAFLCFGLNFTASAVYLTKRAESATKAIRLVGIATAAVASIAGSYLYLSNASDTDQNVAWACATLGAVCAILSYIADAKQTDALAVAAAEVGIICCTVVLVTGPIWARKAWGVWWAWDLRLTTTLMLWLIYLAYLMLRRFSSTGNAPLLAAVLAVFSFADVPFVWFAIRFRDYRGNHPKPVFGSGPNQGLHPAILKAFLWNLAAFTAFGILLLIVRYALERARQIAADRRLALAMHKSNTAGPAFSRAEMQEVP